MECNATYPTHFIRGIPNKDFVQNGQVLQLAFQFDEQERDDNMLESSINWLDDEGAITQALNQRKENGKIQFTVGVTKVELSSVKTFLHCISEETFSYERSPLTDNKYHGNLLVSSTTTKQIKQLIMNGLALAAGTNIIAQPNLE